MSTSLLRQSNGVPRTVYVLDATKLDLSQGLKSSRDHPTARWRFSRPHSIGLEAGKPSSCLPHRLLRSLPTMAVQLYSSGDVRLHMCVALFLKPVVARC